MIRYKILSACVLLILCACGACGLWHNDMDSARATTETPQPVEQPEPPWGTDNEAYALWQMGALDEFVPKGDRIYSAKCADLNLDGITDVLMLTDASAPEAMISSNNLGTFLLLGDGAGGFSVAAHENEIAYFSIYGDSTQTQVGDGWFKFENAVGKAGGYEHSSRYEYDVAAREWVLAERYHNQFGYNVYGISCILTPVNFGRQVFATPGTAEENGESIDYDYQSGNVSVSGQYPSVTFQDKGKEDAINQILKEDYMQMADYLKKQEAQCFLRSEILLQTPLVLSVQYEIWGEVNGVDLRRNGRHYATVIDLSTEQRVQLSDVIGVEDWGKYVCGDFENWSVEGTGSMTSEFPATFDRLPEFCSHLESVLSPGTSGFFWAIHERSLAIYWQPNFWNSSIEDAEMYLSKELIAPYVKLDLWGYESRAASHIEWQG